MKRTIIILLIAACVAVTLYINQTKKLIAPEVKAEIEQTLLDDPLFPARPVWWSDDKILAVGIASKSMTGNAAAEKACQLLKSRSLPISGLVIEVYDVIKIQKADDWGLLGSGKCP
jgi:hypothetical protein